MYLLSSIFSFFAARSPYVLEIIEHYCCTYIGLFGAVFNSSAKGLDVIPHQKQQTSYNGCPEFHRFRHGSFLHIFNSISCAAEKCNNVEEKQSKWWKEHKHLKKRWEKRAIKLQHVISRRWDLILVGDMVKIDEGFLFFFFFSGNRMLVLCCYTHRKCKDQSLIRLDGNHHVPLSSILLIIPPQDPSSCARKKFSFLITTDDICQ